MPFSLPKKVLLREVSPRDGLQNVKFQVATADKVRMVDALSATGLPVIEAAAFVSPKWVPQMADGEEVLATIMRRPGTRYSALVPNLKGYERAIAAKADEVVLFVSACEVYAKKNTNSTIAESLEAQRPVVERAKADGVPASVDVSMAFGSPYVGDIAPAEVARVARAMVEMGCREVYLADTTGTGHPRSIAEVIETVRKAAPDAVIGLHLHDTRGLAVANVLAALDLGVDRFDCSAGGIGGGPYAEGATGNVSTEDLVWMLESMGIETGVDLPKLLEAGAVIEEIVQRPLSSKMLRAGVPKGYRGGA